MVIFHVSLPEGSWFKLCKSWCFDFVLGQLRQPLSLLIQLGMRSATLHVVVGYSPSLLLDEFVFVAESTQIQIFEP